ncbi:MAG: hypothetical protein WA058_00185 [Minisyncoccia bacterium]
MNQPNHHQHPEIWFRPSPALSLEVLSELIETGNITATPRLGKRDAEHPKGYIPGTVATLRLHDANRQEKFCMRVRIENVCSKPLRDLGVMELGSVAYYVQGLPSVQQDLSFFEGRPVAADEMVSVIKFSYLK